MNILFAQYDALCKVRNHAHKDLVTESRPLHKDYGRLVNAGTKPNLAKVSLARKIAAITLAIWKHKEEYNPAKYTKSS